MNINCTSNCIYQADGKCTMDHVPDMLNAVAVSLNDNDCPYFSMT